MGARLRYVREVVVQLSTQALADELQSAGLAEGEGASNASVTRYEKGRGPSLDYLVAISELSGVPLDWIVLNRSQPGEAGYVIDQFRKLADALESEDPRARTKSAMTGAKTVAKARRRPPGTRADPDQRAEGDR